MHGTENWDQKGYGKQDPVPSLEPVDGCHQSRWYGTPWAWLSFAVREHNDGKHLAEA